MTVSADSARTPREPFASIYFDCDSTLATIEGVDELLRYADPALRADVLKLTAQAMDGTVPLAEVYATRLKKLGPRREQLDAVGQHYIEHQVTDAAATIRALQALGKHVGIVSGGLLAPVQHLAAHLGVPADCVHAVPLLFDTEGNYLDFDRSSPLWQNGGKIDVVQAAPAAHHPMAFVGDGVTDLETKASVARFVGFGGVEERQAVRDGADFYTSKPSLAAILPFVLTTAERAQLAALGGDRDGDGDGDGESFTSLLSRAEA
ncbi:MAG: HAD family hydrolase [Planctomycetota bacterium]